MCSNNFNNNNVLANNINSCNNPNPVNGNIGLAIENGNNTVLSTNINPYNNGEVLSTNINTLAYNGNNLFNNNSSNFNDNNSCGCNCNENNSCACNCNGNNSCSCNSNNNNYCGCNCNDNNLCGCNNTSTLSDNVTNNSLQENLRNFIGRRVTLEFNICGNCSKKTGILTCVGCNFVTLRGVNNNNCLLADTEGLNFVTVHNCNC